jgi:hypothetical protein
MFSTAVPLPPNLRAKFPFLVRMVHRYYGTVRLLKPLWSTLKERPHDVRCNTRGQDGFATSFSIGSCIPYKMPVYPGALRIARYSRTIGRCLRNCNNNQLKNCMETYSVSRYVFICRSTPKIFAKKAAMAKTVR